MLTQIKIKKEEKKSKKLYIECFLPKKTKLSNEEPFVLFQDDPQKTIFFQGYLRSEINSPVSGKVSLIFSEEEVPLENTPTNITDISSCVFEKSLKIEDAQGPHSINITLQAEWVQKNEGTFDIGPYISAHFPQGIVSSLNQSFAPCHIEGHKSGYTILNASFEPISPPSTGILNLYPSFMPKFCIKKEKTHQVITLPRYWFQVIWKMHWDYEQKRIEKLSFTWPFCPFSEHDHVYDIILKVQNPEEIEGFCQTEASLLPKKLWPKISQKILSQLKYELFEKFQSLITFSTTFERGISLKLGQNIQIISQGKIIQGKIKKIECWIDAHRKEAHITIKSAPPWLQEWVQRSYTLENFQEETPLEGLTTPELTEKDGTTDIIIENDALTQFEKLALHSFSHKHDIDNFLSENATRVCIKLKNLKTYKHLTHSITASVTHQKEVL